MYAPDAEVFFQYRSRYPSIADPLSLDEADQLTVKLVGRTLDNVGVPGGFGFLGIRVSARLVETLPGPPKVLVPVAGMLNVNDTDMLPSELCPIVNVRSIIVADE